MLFHTSLAQSDVSGMGGTQTSVSQSAGLTHNVISPFSPDKQVNESTTTATIAALLDPLASLSLDLSYSHNEMNFVGGSGINIFHQVPVKKITIGEKQQCTLTFTYDSNGNRQSESKNGGQCYDATPYHAVTYNNQQLPIMIDFGYYLGILKYDEKMRIIGIYPELKPKQESITSVPDDDVQEVNIDPHHMTFDASDNLKSLVSSITFNYDDVDNPGYATSMVIIGKREGEEEKYQFEFSYKKDEKNRISNVVAGSIDLNEERLRSQWTYTYDENSNLLTVNLEEYFDNKNGLDPSLYSCYTSSYLYDNLNRFERRTTTSWHEDIATCSNPSSTHTRVDLSLTYDKNISGKVVGGSFWYLNDAVMFTVNY